MIIDQTFLKEMVRNCFFVQVASALNSGSPMSFLKAKQKQTLKRASSCPDIHKIEEIVAAKNDHKKSKKANSTTVTAESLEIDASEDDEQNNDKTLLLDNDKSTHVSVQTDEFLVTPYEHLFPFVLPQWLSSETKNTNGNGGNTKHVKDEDTPYEILDRYVQAAYDKNTAENNENSKGVTDQVLKNEIALLHNQLLYERHRREVLGLRNRRLLGKTKSSRVLEEQNISLVSSTF